MILILLVRAALASLNVFAYATESRTVVIVLTVTIGVIGLFFVAWCLAVIGEARGERKVHGARIVSQGRKFQLIQIAG